MVSHRPCSQQKKVLSYVTMYFAAGSLQLAANDADGLPFQSGWQILSLFSLWAGSHQPFPTMSPQWQSSQFFILLKTQMCLHVYF